MSRPSIRRLPPAERERRWKQHLASTNRTTPKSSQPARPSQPRSASVSKCSVDYFKSLINPFDARNAGACVPRFPTLTSRKGRYFARGVGACGTTGFGFVSFHPEMMANDASDYAVACSVDTYAGDTIDADGGSGTTRFRLNSPYSLSDFSSNLVQVRIVSAGIKVRYTGTLLNQSGRAIAIEEPDHRTLQGLNIGNVQAFDRAESVPFDKRWVVANRQPVKPSELEFNPFVPGIEAPYLAVLIGAGAGALFEWEAVLLTEEIGRIVRDKTMSHSDVNGFETVTSYLSQAGTKLFDAAANSNIDYSGIATKVLNAGANYAAHTVAASLNNGGNIRII